MQVGSPEFQRLFQPFTGNFSTYGQDVPGGFPAEHDFFDLIRQDAQQDDPGGALTALTNVGVANSVPVIDDGGGDGDDGTGGPGSGGPTGSVSDPPGADAPADPSRGAPPGGLADFGLETAFSSVDPGDIGFGLGNAIGGPVTGGLVGLGVDLATGQPTGRSIGSNLGKGLGLALGGPTPAGLVSSLTLSAFFGWIGSFFDPPEITAENNPGETEGPGGFGTDSTGGLGVGADDPGSVGSAESGQGRGGQNDSIDSEDAAAGGTDAGSDSSKIICTAMNRMYGFGGFRSRIWLDYSRVHLPDPAWELGYHKLFVPLVARMPTNRLIRTVLGRIARVRTVGIRNQMRGRRLTLEQILYRVLLRPPTYCVGWLVKHGLLNRAKIGGRNDVAQI